LGRFLQRFVIAFAAILAFAGTARALTVQEMLDEGTLGNPKAPVTIIEYASLTCPHCANFANHTFEALKAKYVDTGKVHFIFRDFPFDQVGLRAAMMARCGGPGSFFGYIAMIYKTQDSWIESKDPMGEIEKIGRLGGMTKQQFDACMNDKALLDGILKVRQDAIDNLKVDATPTFFVNGVKHEGDMSIDEFDKILAPLLKNAS